MRNDLKPCPFCGSQAQRLTRTPFYNQPQFKGRRAIVCLACGVFMLGRTEVDAKNLWNRRTEAST